MAHVLIPAHGSGLREEAVMTTGAGVLVWLGSVVGERRWAAVA
ncbi:hypothetical protein [Streptomyces sp. NPDC023327]